MVLNNAIAGLACHANESLHTWCVSASCVMPEMSECHASESLASRNIDTYWMQANARMTRDDSINDLIIFSLMLIIILIIVLVIVRIILFDWLKKI